MAVMIAVEFNSVRSLTMNARYTRNIALHWKHVRCHDIFASATLTASGRTQVCKWYHRLYKCTYVDGVESTHDGRWLRFCKRFAEHGEVVLHKVLHICTMGIRTAD